MYKLEGEHEAKENIKAKENYFSGFLLRFGTR
jgi:hypothetical protein